MYDVLMIVERWGPSAGLLILMLIIMIPVVKWLNKLDTKIKRHSHIMEEIKEDVDKIHDRCHVPVGAVRDLEKKVIALEKQDLLIDGNIKKIEEHMKAQDNSMSEIKTDIKSVLNILIERGINGSYK